MDGARGEFDRALVLPVGEIRYPGRPEIGRCERVVGGQRYCPSGVIDSRRALRHPGMDIGAPEPGARAVWIDLQRPPEAPERQIVIPLLTFPRKSGSSANCVDLVRSDAIGEDEGTWCKMEDERALFSSWVPHCNGDASGCGEPAHHS